MNKRDKVTGEEGSEHVAAISKVSTKASIGEFKNLSRHKGKGSIDEADQPSIVDMGDDILRSSSSEDTNATKVRLSKTLQQGRKVEVPRPKKKESSSMDERDHSSSTSFVSGRSSGPNMKRPAGASNTDRISAKRAREAVRQEFAAESHVKQEAVRHSSFEIKRSGGEVHEVLGAFHNEPQIATNLGNFFQQQQLVKLQQLQQQLQQQQQQQQQQQLQQQHHLEQLLQRQANSVSLNAAAPLTPAERIFLISTQRRSAALPQQSVDDSQHLQLLFLRLQQQQHLQQQGQEAQMSNMPVASLAQMPITTGEWWQGLRPVNFYPFANVQANLAALRGGSASHTPLESVHTNLSHSNLLSGASTVAQGLLHLENPFNVAHPNHSLELLASLLPASAPSAVVLEIPETPRNPELEWRSAQLCQQAQEFIEAWQASQDAETLEELKQEGRWSRKRKTPKRRNL